MAGIGFRLKALVVKGSYLEATTAYLSSAVISTGPWLSGVVALIVLDSTTATYLNQDDRSLLLATVIAVFAASLFMAGGPQMLLTRYLADRVYANDNASIAPTCTGVLFLNVPLALLTAPFLFFAPFTLSYRLLTVTLFLTLTMTWLITVFLSAARNFKRIVLIYGLSYACGSGASLLLGQFAGLTGSLAGFLFGQILCLSLLLGCVYHEFPSAQSVSWAYLRYLSKYWDLLLIGTLYTLGTLIDSFLFWMSPHGVTIHGFYHLFPPYDTARFIVYLSTIPAAAIFMIHLETHFYRHYSAFYRFIRTKGTLSDLVRARQGMVAAVRAGVWTLLKVQGIIALFLCVAARDLATFLGLAPHWAMLVRVEAFAGLGQFMLFTMMLFLLYLDQRRSVLLIAALFLFSNAALTLASLYLGELFYGMGYLIAGWLGAILGWFLLNAHFKQLEYQTFMTQPLG
ncbi:MAG: exopolysaccharide Pel transporter PelG [Ktedonobacteraceae bacterium]